MRTHLFDVRFPVLDQGTRFFDHVANVSGVLVDSHGYLERSHTERQVKTTQAQRLLRRLTSKDVAESVELVRTDYDQGKVERFSGLNKLDLCGQRTFRVPIPPLPPSQHASQDVPEILYVLEVFQPEPTLYGTPPLAALYV